MSPDIITPEQIDEFFDQNAEELAAEGTYALSPWIRDVARAQVQLYWRRLRRIAERVTRTEERLQLPAQRSPAGRTFGIEGIVDIVREDDGRTTMYDIKTHDAAYVRANSEQYEKQLNIYAHIWSALRGERLDETAVICTALPDDVHNAFISDDEAALVTALSRWDPVIPIAHEERRVAATIREFGAVVDRIESHDFEPPAVELLNDRVPGTKVKFAVYVCVNCDARFACRSYQAYAFGSRGRSESAVSAYLSDPGDDSERDDIAMAALDARPPFDADYDE